MRAPELLSPAGDMERLKCAILYGADAVYIGGKDFSLRAQAENFDIDEIKLAVDYCHEHGKRLYVAVNVFPRNKDFEKLPSYLKSLKSIGVDAVIVSDPGIFFLIKKEISDLKIHLSTQANNTNYMSAQFWAQQGVKRIVLARELNLKDVREIVDKCPQVEFELFIHGAMCISYSGRCFLSAYLTDRDANKGDCSHPCRWKYSVLEESERPGEYYPIEEYPSGTMIFNSKDLCLIRHIPELIETGISSFKIEGRMKTLYYIACVTRAYRQAIDSYCSAGKDFVFDEELAKELSFVNNRGYTTGFYFGDPKGSEYKYKTQTVLDKHFYLGKILEKKGDFFKAELKNTIKIGDELGIVMPSIKDDKIVKVKNIIKEAKEVDRANAQDIVEFIFEEPFEFKDMALMRKIV